MTTWILILTLYSDRVTINSKAMTSSIESITGFKTQSACMSAANSWLKQNNVVDHIRALCVPDK